MKIKVTRELKIAMIEAFQTGYLDLWKCHDILKEIKGVNIFYELLQESGLIDAESEQVSPNGASNNE